MCSGPAIPLDKLMPPCSLWCSAPEVVCIPQPGAVSHSYYTPPDLCVLGSVMSLLTWSGFAVPIAHCVFKQGGGVHMCVCVCVCVCLQPESPGSLTCSLSSKRMAGMCLNSSGTQSRWEQQPLPIPSCLCTTSCLCTALVSATTGALTDGHGSWDSCSFSYFLGSSTFTTITVSGGCSAVLSLVIPDIVDSGAAPPQMQAWGRPPKSWLWHLQVRPCRTLLSCVFGACLSTGPHFIQGSPTPSLFPCPVASSVWAGSLAQPSWRCFCHS